MKEKTGKNTMNIKVDLRYVVVALVVALAVVVYLWKPWDSGTAIRTIEATGTSTIEAEPDQYMFSPSYQEKGTDRAAIQKTLSEKVTGIITKLKEMGIADSDIVLASSTYDNYWNDGTNEITSNSLTITVKDKEMAQKVQDYLLTTAPEGQITPYPTFSDSKRKELEKQARNDAVKDAKKNAESVAAELDADLGKVVSVTDSSLDQVMPMFSEMKGGVATLDTTRSSEVAVSLPVTPGKQKIPYSVKVKYQIK